MKAIAVTLEGMERLASEEINGIIKSKTKQLVKGRLLFETKSLKPLEKVRTIRKLYSYLNHFKFKTEEEIYKQVEKLKFPIKMDFAVRCYRQGEHDFKSKHIESKIGEVIFERGNKVKLKNPETTVYVEIIDNTCLIGILYKKDMQKRFYKIRLNPASINACLAAGMIILSKAGKEQVIVDPFCKDGVIIIEAALMGIKTVYGFDESLNNIKNSRVNSQLAKANVELSKAEVDWLDTKFEKGTIDKIITIPPFPAKHKNRSEVEKVTKELMHQAKFVLKKQGLMILATQNSKLVEKYAKENRFKLMKNLEITIGNTIYKVQAFKP